MAMSLLLGCILAAFSLEFTVHTCMAFRNRTISWEKRLLRDLGQTYAEVGRTGRPVTDIHTTIRLRFRVGLIKLELDEKNKLLTLSTWTRYNAITGCFIAFLSARARKWDMPQTSCFHRSMTLYSDRTSYDYGAIMFLYHGKSDDEIWRDEYLQWNPSEYGGVDKIRKDPNSIWMPDVVLYNTGVVKSEHRHVQCVVTWNGEVTFYTLAIYKTSCALNLANFPFDQQQCSLWFGSWTHNASELNIYSKAGMDLSSFDKDFKETAGWEVISSAMEKSYVPNRNETPNYAVIIFNLTLMRKVVFSTYLLTLPCVFLACLTLVVFWLPPGRADRTSLAMSTFGSFMVELLILVEAAPPTTASVPTLGVYYCFNIVIIVVAVILSTIVVNVSEGLPGHVPAIIMRIITGPIGKILLLRDPPKFQGIRSLKSAKHSTERENLVNNELANLDTSNGYQPSSFSCSDCVKAREEILKLANELKTVKASIVTTEGPLRSSKKFELEQYRKKSWKVFGLFLDRIFFFAYLAIIIFSLFVFFPRPKQT